MNIFKHNVRENSVINPYIPIIHLKSVLNFSVFFFSFPLHCWRQGMEYFKVTIIFILGTHFLNLQQVIIPPIIVHYEPYH